MGSRLDRLEFGALASLGGCLSLVAAAVTLDGSTSELAWLEAVVRSLSVAVPIAVGLYARQRPPFERFGMLLVLAGVGWFATTLAESREPVLYSTGRIAGWFMEVGLVYLVLAFPTGHVRGRVDRLLVAATAAVVLTLYLPSVLLVEQFPVPAPWTSCHDGCPQNAFMVTATEPAVVDDVMRPLRELAVVLLFAAVAVRLLQRIHRATPLARQVYGPLLAIASLRLAAFAATIVGRSLWPDADVVEASAWLLALGPVLIGGAFMLGLVRWRLYIAGAMQRLASRMRTHPGPADMRDALADAFGDPTLQVAYWIGGADGQWSDAAGHPVRPPPPDSGRWLTEVRDGDQPVAAIIHDAALRDDPAFIDSAASYAVMTLDNHRLAAEASALLDEVNQSRARIQRSADDERRRIERDLHDGAQQRLVHLRIRLELAAEKLNGNADAELFSGLATDVDEALDEVRSLARGIYPSPLADRGVVEALRSAALLAPVPTTVLATGTRRYPREIESAVYFCCLEALQNAGKHAGGAAVVLELADEGERLRFDVRDDGAGFDPGRAHAGVGMTSMRDRLAAVGGELAIVSSPGRGTRVIGTILLEGLTDGPPETRGTRGFARRPQ
ncbi:MAG TPA: histidine kinase [Solirubrobacteraceae bacterium]|nr:histidine kinase [Solirubrobacteraceae bacterium]